MTVTCVDDAPVAVDDSATVARTRRHRDRRAGQRHRHRRRPEADRLGDPAGQRHRGDHRRRHRPDLRAGRQLLQRPAGTTPDTFTYTLNGRLHRDGSVTVTCVDDAPVAVDDAATVAEDAGATAIDVLANDTDIDGGPDDDRVGDADPANGTVVITGGGTGLTYEPDADYCNDPRHARRTPSPTPSTRRLDGHGLGHASPASTTPPVAVNDTATVAEDSAATAIDVLANDTDIDGGPKTIASATEPANGTVVITGGGTGLTYQPDTDYCNNPPGTTPDTFTYTLTAARPPTVSVTVTCVDDAPVAVNDSATVAEDSGATAIDVLANDTDIDGGPKSIASVTQPGNGTVVITGGGTGAHVRSRTPTTATTRPAPPRTPSPTP